MALGLFVVLALEWYMDVPVAVMVAQTVIYAFASMEAFERDTWQAGL